MVKETKKAAEKTATVNNELSTENVLESLKEKNKMPENLATEVMTEIEEDRKKQQKGVLRSKLMHARYVNIKELLQLRARRREEKITLASLKASKEALDKLCAGEITVSEYDDLRRKNEKEKSEAMTKSDKELSDNMRELRASYEGNYCYSWDY